MRSEAKDNLFVILIAAICFFNGLTDPGYMTGFKDFLQSMGRTVK